MEVNGFSWLIACVIRDIFFLLRIGITKYPPKNETHWDSPLAWGRP